MATKIARTGTTPTNTNKYTWSAWIKRGKISVGETIVYNYYDGNNRGYIAFDSDDKLFFYDKTSSEQNNCYATRRFRDTNGWYHIHVKADSTLASNRFVVHINGVQETITGTTIDQNDNLGFKTATGTNQHAIGTNADSTANPFTGVMSHVHYVDGLAIAHTNFGSTDSTTGEWKINTAPTVSEYGANGYFILKDGNSVTDQSGKGNNFTVANGTLTKTEDCPDNVFCTWNKLDAMVNQYHNGLLNGNTTIQTTTSSYPTLVANLGANKGKYYWEVKLSAQSSGTYAEALVGVCSTQITGTQQELGDRPNDYGYYSGGGGAGTIRNNNSSSSYGTAWGVNTIVCVALDLDNNKLYFKRDANAWENSGDPTSGSTGTGAVSITDPDSTPLGVYFPAVSSWSTGQNVTFQTNFGNGYFGTTAVSSAGTNASGIGIFEYDVPTGYTALSTKGLNL